MRTARRRGHGFLLVVLTLTLLIAGGLSYLASPHPDGLDSATLRGCQVVERAGVEELTGQCIAQRATEHTLAGSPLADYSVGGAERTVGAAGVLGVLCTLAVTGLLFRALLRRRASAETTPAADGG